MQMRSKLHVLQSTREWFSSKQGFGDPGSFLSKLCHLQPIAKSTVTGCLEWMEEEGAWGSGPEVFVGWPRRGTFSFTHIPLARIYHLVTPGHIWT